MKMLNQPFKNPLNHAEPSVISAAYITVTIERVILALFG